MKKKLELHAEEYLHELCVVIGDRSVGSLGNREATDFFAKELMSLGWYVEKAVIPVLDWEEGGVQLRSGDVSFTAFVSPYSLECSVQAEMVSITSIEELEKKEADGKIVLLHGGIAVEQLMPKNFVFYNPEEHRKIISLLEAKNIKAIISATGRNSALAGGAYPFPLIEDGDFDIPSVYMTEEEGRKLLSHAGKVVDINSSSKRIPSTCCNIIAGKGNGSRKIVITAHIDAKKGTPGAIDNATGVIVLLLLARRLQNYDGHFKIELAALNGEDYYAVPGQMDYIRRNNGRFEDMLMNINIDGSGYREGDSAFSLFNLPENVESEIRDILKSFSGVTEGAPWPQGDHSIFIQYGVPAIAVTSKWFIDNMDTQAVTHTPKDNPGIVNCSKLVIISDVIAELIRRVNLGV